MAGGRMARRGDGRDHDVASSYVYDDDAKMDAGRQHPSVNIDSAGWLRRVVVYINYPREIDKCVKFSILCVLEDGANEFVRNETMMLPP